MSLTHRDLPPQLRGVDVVSLFCCEWAIGIVFALGRSFCTLSHPHRDAQACGLGGENFDASLDYHRTDATLCTE